MCQTVGCVGYLRGVGPCERCGVDQPDLKELDRLKELRDPQRIWKAHTDDLANRHPRYADG